MVSLVGFEDNREGSTKMFFTILLMVSLTGMDVDSLTAALHVETGMAYLEQGLPDRALEEFNTALDKSDRAVDAYLGLGRIAVINDAWGTAEENYSRYMELRPFDYRAPLEMAEMLLSLPARFDEAVEYADQALTLAPLDGRCWLVVADAEAGLGNTEDAITWYTRTIIENEELAFEARLRMGALLFDIGDLAGSREVLLPAASVGMAEAHRLLSLIYLEQGDHLRARDNINSYLFHEPNGLWADSARAYLEELSFESATGIREE